MQWEKVTWISNVYFEALWKITLVNKYTIGYNWKNSSQYLHVSPMENVSGGNIYNQMPGQHPSSWYQDPETMRKSLESHSLRLIANNTKHQICLTNNNKTSIVNVEETRVSSNRLTGRYGRRTIWKSNGARREYSGEGFINWIIRLHCKTIFSGAIRSETVTLDFCQYVKRTHGAGNLTP